MKAFGKVLGLFFLGLLLLVVALGFALTHLFDPNDYKDEIRQIARDKANLELDLKGDIGWSLFPWLGLELHDTSIASAATPTKPFADLQMLGLSVRVPPLLRKDVQMSAIRVEGLSLTWSATSRARATGKTSASRPSPRPRPLLPPPRRQRTARAPRRRHRSRRRRTTARAPRSSSTSTASTSTTPASPIPTKPAASSTTSRASS